MSWRVAVLLVAVISSISIPLSGQLRNLEVGFPVQLEDAEPIPYGIMIGESNLSYTAYDDRTDQFRASAGIKIGFAERWQASLSLPVFWGTALQTTGGDLLVSALYNVSSEREALPGLSIEGAVDMPMELAIQNADIRLKLIATRTLAPETNLRLHVNAFYGYLTRPGPNERVSRLMYSIGASRDVPGDITLAADYSYEETRVFRYTVNVLEAGIRKGIGSAVTVSASAGIGVGGGSLLYRALAGVQFWICDLVCPPGQRQLNR